MTTILFFYGKFVAASLMLLALYWGVLRGRASYRQIRLYLLLVPVVSLMMSIPRFEVWRPSPTVVEVEAEDVNIDLTTEIPSTLQTVKAVTATYVDGQTMRFTLPRALPLFPFCCCWPLSLIY